MILKVLIVAIFVAGVLLYFWLRFGPLRCPRCRTLNLGMFGPHIGIRRMHFRCRRCGERYTGHARLPL
jgi:hypothetical protein